MRKAFITGTAGFIGYHLAALLLRHGWQVHGYDGMTDYYDVGLKRARHARLLQTPGLCRDRGDAGGCGRTGCRDGRLCSPM